MRCSSSSHAFSTNALNALALFLLPGDTISMMATIRSPLMCRTAINLQSWFDLGDPLVVKVVKDSRLHACPVVHRHRGPSLARLYPSRPCKWVGEAPTHDKTGQLRERLLHKQNENPGP